jgi:hypothetical protein
MPTDSRTVSEVGQFDQLAMTQTPGTVVTLVNTNTIPSNIGIARVTAAGAVTGIIVAPGVRAGQMLCILHEGAVANTLTMAAAGTSNVAAGVVAVYGGLAAHLLYWDSVTSLWYQVGPGAN